MFNRPRFQFGRALDKEKLRSNQNEECTYSIPFILYHYRLFFRFLKVKNNLLATKDQPVRIPFFEFSIIPTT